MTVKKTAIPAPQKQAVSDVGYFELAKKFKRTLKNCTASAGEEDGAPVIFLWACVTHTGIKQGFKKGADSPKFLTQEQWLSVVDEAASLGANWLVFSISDPLSACHDIWRVCQWAQDTHGMMVGLHLKHAKISRNDLPSLKQLKSDRTRLLVRKEAAKSLEWVKKAGFEVWTANPQPDGERPNCQGPTRMIFVTAQGVLYTCGLVEGNEAYRIGHVLDDSLKSIITHPDLPHHVHDDLHYVTPECDGCPALIANFFSAR